MEIISNNLKIFEEKNYDSLIEKISSQDYILPSVQEYISILHSLKDNFYNDWFKYDPLIRNLTGFFVTSTKTLVKSILF